MVKGTSRQVIVVNSPDPKLFEQAIFILKEEALRKGGMNDESLMKEACRLIRESAGKRTKGFGVSGPLWACGGALLMGIVWILTVLL